MITLKKALFVFGFAVGISAAGAAYAFPTYETCVDMRQMCFHGDALACNTFYRTCWGYDLF